MIPLYLSSLNIFLATADLLHFVALFTLIISIWKRKSCEGISGKTQFLFALVFTCRYLDLFLYILSWRNTIFKILYIALTYFTLYLIYWRFRSKENRAQDCFRVEILIIALFGLSLGVNHEFSAIEIAWTFSIYLEAVAVLPQAYMTWKHGSAANCLLYYFIALAGYKALYICNWIYRYYTTAYYDYIKVAAGCLETIVLFYGIWVIQSTTWKPLDEVKVSVIPAPMIGLDMEKSDDKLGPLFSMKEAIVFDTDPVEDSTDTTPLWTNQEKQEALSVFDVPKPSLCTTDLVQNYADQTPLYSHNS